MTVRIKKEGIEYEFDTVQELREYEGEIPKKKYVPAPVQFPFEKRETAKDALDIAKKINKYAMTKSKKQNYRNRYTVGYTVTTRGTVVSHMKDLNRPVTANDLAEQLVNHLKSKTHNGRIGEVTRVLKDARDVRRRKANGQTWYYFFGQGKEIPTQKESGKTFRYMKRKKSPYDSFRSEKIKYYMKVEGMDFYEATRAAIADWNALKMTGRDKL